MPPSCRADGKAYRHVEPLDSFTFAEAPDWLYALLLKKTDKKAENHNQNYNWRSFKQGQGGNRAYAEAALNGEVEAVCRAGPGNRNNLLNISACKLGSLVAAGELNEGDVINVPGEM